MSLFLSLVVLEIVLRWLFPFAPGPRDEKLGALLHIRSTNSRLIYELAPNFNRHTAHAGTHVFTNSFGFRDVEWEIAKPPNTKRIIVVGDSSTFGWSIPSTERYTDQCKKLLNDGSLPVNVDVMNFAVGGYDSAQSVEAALSKGLRFDPDIIIVPYFLNDDIIGADNHIYWHYASTGSKAIDFWILLFRSGWYLYFEDLTLTAYRRLKMGVDPKHTKILIAIFPTVDTSGATEYRYADRHAQIISFCKELGFTCVDLYEDFKKAGFSKVIGDGVHPTVLGHQLAAEVLTPVLRKMLIEMNSGF